MSGLVVQAYIDQVRALATSLAESKRARDQAQNGIRTYVEALEAGRAAHEQTRAELEQLRADLATAQAELALLRERVNMEESARCASETLMQQTGSRLSKLQEVAASACQMWESTENHSLHEIRTAMRALRTVIGEPTAVHQRLAADLATARDLLETAAVQLRYWNSPTADTISAWISAPECPGPSGEGT